MRWWRSGDDMDLEPQAVLDRIERLGRECRAARGYAKRHLMLELADVVGSDMEDPPKTHAGVHVRWHLDIKNLRRAVELAKQHGFEPPRDHRKLRAQLSRFLRRLMQSAPELVPDSIAELTVGVSVGPAPEVAPS